jgi:hypothetical protein
MPLEAAGPYYAVSPGSDPTPYSLNNLTAKKRADGSIAVQVGGCDGKVVNCLPVMAGWNCSVRLYAHGPKS